MAKTNTKITSKTGKEYSYARIKRTIGHEWKDGKKVPITKQFTGTSKKDAEAKYKAFLEEQAKAKYSEEQAKIDESKKTFGEYAERFTYDILPTLHYAHGTKEQYERSYRVHVKGTWLADTILPQITTKAIQDFYNELNVSKQTLNAIHKWMSAFNKWMVANNYTTDILSPVTMPIKRDAKRNNDIVIWEQDEIRKIFACAEAEDYRLAFLLKLLYYSGLRISEALGLQYGDIRDGMIYVDRQYERGILCAPKHGSYRSIPIHSVIESELIKYSEWHSKEMKKNKYKTDYIFTTSTGKPLDYYNVRNSFNRFYKRNNIPLKKIHAYRSTFCTELCRAGVALEVASKLMGHKSVEVTAKHYALIRVDTKIDAISKLPSI